MTTSPGFATLLWAEYISAALVFVILFFVNAPYGRFVRRGWGPTLPARWAWFVMELPAFAVILAVTLHLSRGMLHPAPLLLLILWELHYAYRVLVYPFLKRGAGKPFPFLIVIFALLFNSLNGYVNGASLADPGAAGLPGALIHPRFVAGVLFFVAGFAVHAYSDAHLRSLRAGTETGYQIPRRGLFQLVSCPHYLGEILEWCGWALAAWSPASLAFAVFTIANLAPRAWAHHRWYRATFPDYPKERRALVPFVW